VDLEISGQYLFAGDKGYGLRVFDLTDPSAPVLAGSVRSPGWMTEVAVYGNHAFLADGWAGLTVVDVTDPTAPEVAASLETPGDAVGVSVAGAYALVSDGASFQMVDITHPAAPVLGPALGLPSYAISMATRGNYAFVADHWAGLVIVGLGTGGAQPITGVRLVTTQAETVTWEITADGGANWQAILPDGAWNPVVHTGTDLRWRSSHSVATFGVNPACSDLVVEWTHGVRMGSPSTDVGPGSLPAIAASHRVSPNPFRTQTAVRYDVPEGSGDLRIDIFDVSGRLVRRLASGPALSGGHTLNWDGTDDASVAVGAGVYFVRYTLSGHSGTRKVTLLR
jgi:hypothetical protein